MATLAVNQAIGLASSLLQSELAAHTARLKDATNENEAMDQVVPAFDADLAAIQQAFATGTSSDDCIAALQAVDSNIFAYLHALVGKPGTAWGGPTTAEIGPGINPTYSADCNKNCTASCCVYLNDLRPAIFGRNVNKPGMIEAISDGGGIVNVPGVEAPPNSAYGNYSRAAYSLKITAPAFGLSLASQALQVS